MQNKSYESSYADPQNYDTNICHTAQKRKCIYLVLTLSSLAASGLPVSVGTVGPLSLGEDELVYTVASAGVENLDITALMETQGLTCHPTSIISFNSDHCCVTALASGTQAVSIISGMAEDGAVEDYHMHPGAATTSGVVAMAEVCVTGLLGRLKQNTE